MNVAIFDNSVDYIYTLYDLVTLGVLLADTRSNEHDIGHCRLQEYKPKGKITIIINNNDA